MAEENKDKEPNNGESVKLFVGQVPKHMTEAQLIAMFNEFALIEEVNIIKDKTTRTSRGLLWFFFPFISSDFAYCIELFFWVLF